MTFLQSLARRLYSRYGDGISSLRIVFPSRRAQLFFSEALTELIDKPIWEPVYTSVEKIAEEFTPLRKADDFSLLIELYRIYVKHTGSKESFDRFYFWGEALLRDFNDIDNHLVDAGMLFRNLKEQKELEGDFSFLTPEQIQYLRSFWSTFEPGKSGKLHERFVEIWDALPAVYADFRTLLLERGAAYSGMIYRDAAEKIRTVGAEKLAGRYIFAGFNALSECERILFAGLRDEGKAEFYWDYSPYYVENRKQEAGYFMRDNLENFPANEVDVEETNEIFNFSDVHIVSAPSDVLQAKALPSILKEMDVPCDRRTAIVLADESLLIPVLYSLPEDCDEINVTLGYPLQHTPIFALAELLIRLQNSYKLGAHTGFYHKDALSVLKHSYIVAIAGGKCSEIADYIVKNNVIYAPESLFSSDLSLRKIFVPPKGCEALIDYLSDIFAAIATIDDKGETEQAALRKEYIFHISKALNKLKTSMAEHKLDIGKPVFLSLIRNIFLGLKIPFAGEPIRGMQIMELKETRALDFENLVLLSANEGRLPRESAHPSFIPYNLKRAYGMPYAERNEAVSAYYFYRLLQRARKVRLLYSSKTDGIRTGEMSRYLYQLKFESGLAIKEYSVNYDINFKEKSAVEIPKDKRTMEKLALYATPDSGASLSPSSLSAYIACPLKFYFDRIMRIKTTGTVNEELPANLLGNIVHKLMERLYEPMIDRRVSADEIRALIEDEKLLDGMTDKALAEEFYKTDSLPPDFAENGNMLIARYVIGRYLRGILKYDAENPNFTPKCLEKKIRTIYPLRTNYGLLELNVGGIIDRLDSSEIAGDRRLRVVDYKTGAGRGTNRMKFGGVRSLFSKNPDERNSEVFQTFLYCAMLCMNKEETKPIPALYFVRDCYSPQFSCEIKDTAKNEIVYDFGDYAAEFRERLDACLSELFDPDLPFVQTEYEKTCTYCPFAKICGRDTN